ncbi:uncharacterized mitochondrial protein AtMg00820-like [Stegodyphus dumicola]|uniref:uncharacterized mitochondrial protein AtMg00820-like n=1 Tax=Stegodyphus dumicola TaxID=202533 RepID=UPI0015A81C6A|nr:uncharacterized mitochondrial protein AtMg00820-like [Stegodyphus dumicola]
MELQVECSAADNPKKQKYEGSTPKKAFQNDPETLEEALTSPDAEKWKLAMEEELENLKRNETWDIVPRPEGRKVVKCKWVFKRKLNKDGQVERYKARLVARGYTQVEGIDYKETFSPVIKTKSIRTLLAFSVEQDWQVHQLGYYCSLFKWKN